ncbi:MAG: pyridoxamine 5'-phosphate oxidase family protein [Candidatus Heimdallarchaeota archaeon]
MDRVKLDEIPSHLQDFLHNQRVGYLSTISTRKNLSCIPMHYVFFDNSPYFLVSKNSEKLPMLKKNRKAAFVVDNGGLMLEALGCQFQGKFEFINIDQDLVDSSHCSPKNRILFEDFVMMRLLSFRITFWEGYTFYILNNPKFTDTIPTELLEPLLTDESLIRAAHFETANDFQSFEILIKEGGFHRELLATLLYEVRQINSEKGKFIKLLVESIGHYRNILETKQGYTEELTGKTFQEEMLMIRKQLEENIRQKLAFENIKLPQDDPCYKIFSKYISIE